MTNNKTPEDQRSGGHEVISVVFVGPGNMSRILAVNERVFGFTITLGSLKLTPFGNTLDTLNRNENCLTSDWSLR